jgi:tetratricopeptide (TPR) repeat protein
MASLPFEKRGKAVESPLMAARKSARVAVARSIAVVIAGALACAFLSADRGARGHRRRPHRGLQGFPRPIRREKYAEAQPFAERLVALTEEQYGPTSWYGNPLTNLATIHYKQGHYAAAIENYQRALRILQAKSTSPTNSSFVRCTDWA